MKYTKEDIGIIIDYTKDDDGSFFEERIVAVFCRLCGANFVGPINMAGGFLARHDFFHTWEFKLEMSEEMEA